MNDPARGLGVEARAEVLGGRAVLAERPELRRHGLVLGHDLEAQLQEVAVVAESAPHRHPRCRNFSGEQKMNLSAK